MLCRTSFIVTDLVSVFVMVEAAARTSHAGDVFVCFFFFNLVVGSLKLT